MKNLKGWDVYSFSVLESTNDEAKKEYVQKSLNKSLIITDKQTKGRGRRDKVWIDSSNNIFLSFVLDFEIKNLGYLSIISSLSVFQTIKQINPKIDIKIKWPNDVLIDNKKISGILIEKEDKFIVGIGINLKTSPKNLDNDKYTATNLANYGIDTNKDEFIEMFIDVFNKNLELFEKNKIDLLRKNWLENTKGLNEKIKVKLEHREIEGVFIGIDENCGLIIKKNDTGIEKVYSGEVYMV